MKLLLTFILITGSYLVFATIICIAPQPPIMRLIKIVAELGYFFLFITLIYKYYYVQISSVQESADLEEPISSLAEEHKVVGQQTSIFSVTEQEEMEELKHRLLLLMEQEKTYLEENLTLSQLAQLLNTTNRKLSKLFNQVMQVSYYDFLNTYRINEVKTKILDPSFAQCSILEIAYDSGFKSKSSFNRIFRQKMDCSPSQYKASKSAT